MGIQKFDHFLEDDLEENSRNSSTLLSNEEKQNYVRFADVLQTNHTTGMN